VYYYFLSQIGDSTKTLAVISVYSRPDQRLCELSYHTLLSCTRSGDSDLRVIDVKLITAVVAMVPHTPFPGETTRYFVVEKPGLEVMVLGGGMEEVPDDE